MKLQTDINFSDIESGDTIQIVELLTGEGTLYTVFDPLSTDRLQVFLDNELVNDLRTFITKHEGVNNTIIVIR